MPKRAQWLQTASLLVASMLLLAMMEAIDAGGYGRHVNAIAALTTMPLILAFTAGLFTAFSEYERGLCWRARRERSERSS